MQLYNVFRNRWCGVYWVAKGIRVIPTMNWGDESTIGDDGLAVKEIHYTDHSTPAIHTNPHGHLITFEHGHPDWGNARNGIGSDFFKMFQGVRKMPAMIYDTSTPEDNRFKTISEFKMCLRHGGEIEFDWKGTSYCCFGRVRPASGTDAKMLICQAGTAEVNKRTEMWCDTADELLEYMTGEDRLRDVITQVTVLFRTI